MATIKVIAKSHKYRKTIPLRGKKLMFNQTSKCNVAAWSEPGLVPFGESSIKGFPPPIPLNTVRAGGQLFKMFFQH